MAGQEDGWRLLRRGEEDGRSAPRSNHPTCPPSSSRQTWTIRRMASSISASVVVAPKLKRSEDFTNSFDKPMARSVGDNSVEPLEQAEPTEQATPARSNAIRNISPSWPGKATLLVLWKPRVRWDRRWDDSGLRCWDGSCAAIPGAWIGWGRHSCLPRNKGDGGRGTGRQKCLPSRNECLPHRF